MKSIQLKEYDEMLFPKVNVNKIHEVELFFINDFIKEDSTVLDIGANEGLYLHFFDKINKYKKVIGFEPIPALNKRLRGFFPNLDVFDYAVSNKSQNSNFKIPLINNKRFDTRGTLEDFVEENETGNSTFVVKTITLDDFVNENAIDNIGGIKIDVEGHELKVILGGKNTLATQKPFLMIEIEQRHHKDISIVNIFSEVLALGYQGFFFDPQNIKFEMIADFNFDVHQNNSSNYINNFLFMDVNIDLTEKLKNIELKYKLAKNS
jgi:FkbM family methyltransferase